MKSYGASWQPGRFAADFLQVRQAARQGKFVLQIIVGWADSFIVCPRGLVTAWAQKRAHPTFIDFKHNYLENKLALGC